MVTVVLLAIGVFVVVGAVYMAVSKGQAGGRHAQSAGSVVHGQRQEKARGNSVRVSGGDD